MCEKHRPPSKFYDATNPMIDKNGLMSVCRDHCNEIYNNYFSIYNNLEIALQLTCQDLDVRFSKEALKQTQSHIEKLLSQGKKAEVVFGYYKSKLSSTGKTNERLDCFRYKDSDFNCITDNTVELYNNPNEINNTIDNLEENDNNFDVTLDIIKYWGRNKESWEYEYLEEEMYKIKTSFECPDYGMEMIMRDICYINLDVEKIRQSGKDNKGDVNKLIETRSKLMNDAKIKPIQSSGAEANDQITFGTLIKKLENERPTDEPLDEWKDPDNFEKWHKIFVGHLADMNDIDNETVREYKELIKPYTVIREDEENGD
jgi:hypothetical protein